ncbi:UNVERIFIED_CONTAM: hypothetical protein K2H54_018174 [Gekko kuhli]
MCVSACHLGYYRDESQHCKPHSAAQQTMGCCRKGLPVNDASIPINVARSHLPGDIRFGLCAVLMLQVVKGDSCLSCDSGAACTSCRDPSEVLLFGECQYDSCAPQYYLDFSSKTCKECDWSCNACSGPRSSDCLQCMEGYVLHDGDCIKQCPLAFYKESDMCQRCDVHCLQCRAPGECDRCEPPFLLLDSRCVMECGKPYYADHGEQKCTACPEGCLECDGASRCRVCDAATFLQEGRCVSDCGHGFYGHPRKRECEVIVHAPVLGANGSLQVGIGGVKPLDVSIMDVRGLDGQREELLFQVASSPTNGRLLLVATGRERELNQGDHFTWEDVAEQRVLFVHDKEKSR